MKLITLRILVNMLISKKVSKKSIYKFFTRCVIIFFSNCLILDLYNLSFNREVLQHNYSKMEQINSYSTEFVIDYVAISRSYDDVVNTLNEIQELADTICYGINNDYDKVQAIHNYVCRNLSYDHVSANNSANLETISLKHILKEKKTICAGFSNLFTALCNVEGIYCVNIRGTSKTKDIKDLSNDDTPTNHEWNAVFVENHWIFIDCTWDCQNHYYGSGYIYNDFVNTYFDVSERKMSLDHKIKIVDYRNFFDAINYFNTR